MAKKKSGTDEFTMYLKMGAGFAAGVAIISLGAAGVSYLAREVYKKAMPAPAANGQQALPTTTTDQQFMDLIS